MKIKILSWNVRGVNDRNKRSSIKALIRAQKVDLVCLQETKMSQMSLGVVRSLGVGRFLDWGVLNARGAAGGVLVFWDKKSAGAGRDGDGSFLRLLPVQKL